MVFISFSHHTRCYLPYSAPVLPAVVATLFARILNMAHRFSRSENGKWKDERPPPPKKPPVRIPESNVSDLIDRHKYTLIGRVTNPKIQKTHALVEFFLQQWNVAGRITGRDLGPHLFQFSFESEKDLQVILSKSPFHFKRWMIGNQ